MSRGTSLASVVLFTALAAACSKDKATPTAAPAATPAPSPTVAAQTPAPAPTPTASGGGAPAAANAAKGTIEGVVTFTGAVPAPKPIDKVSDPVCAAAKPIQETISVGKDKGLKDVLVRIAVGGATGEAPETPAHLEQNGCEYVPHVLGAVAGQDLEIVNADKTMHNVHTYKGEETVLNAGQPAGSAPLKKLASDEPGVLKVKCDVHPWMTAYVVVTDHPFFAVTDADGKFSIPKVPAGTYTIEAWHPELGTITKTVTVAGDKSVDPGIVFTGAEKKPE